MNIKEIEKSFLEHIKCHGGICSPFGKFEFTNNSRIGQGGGMDWYIWQRLMKKRLRLNF